MCRVLFKTTCCLVWRSCWVINLDERATKPGKCGVMLYLKSGSWVYWWISIVTVLPIWRNFFNTLSNHQRFGHHIGQGWFFLRDPVDSSYMLENTVIHSLNSQLTRVLWRSCEKNCKRRISQVMILLWGFMDLRKWLSFCWIKLLFLSFSFLVSGEFGDHDPRTCRSGYLSECQFFPNQVCASQNSYNIR